MNYNFYGKEIQDMVWGRKLAFAQAVFEQVNRLKLYISLFEEPLCFFGDKVLSGE